jgi:two-component system response regulator
MKTPLIYVVEDDKDERFFIEEAFNSFLDIIQVQILYFTNGRQVIDALKSQADLTPNFILMDINMPIMNGIEALKVIASSPVLKSIPVVMFSTSKAEEEIAACLNFGAKKYITKPESMMQYPILLKELFLEQIGNLI